MELSEEHIQKIVPRDQGAEHNFHILWERLLPKENRWLKDTCKRVMTECFQYFVILEMIY